MIKLPGNFFDGADVIMTGRGRAGLALAALVASTVGIAVNVMPDNQTISSQTNGAPHFSLTGNSPAGDRVRIVGEGTPESVERLRTALASYASDGNIHRLGREAVGMGARVSVNPAISMTPHDDRQAAMAAVGMVMFMQTSGR